LFLTLLVTLAIMFLLSGCQATKEPPLFGPWDVKTMTNTQLDVLLRNTFSDGWQSAVEVNKL
jgi:hypothetical protein